MYDFEFSALVKRTAEALKASDGSSSSFLRITQQAAKGTGVRNKDDLKKITTRVRNELSAHSAASRSAKAASRRVAQKIAQRQQQ